MKKILIVLFLILVFLAGRQLVQQEGKTTKTSDVLTQTEGSVAGESYQLSDVAEHAEPSDCWTTIEGKVYNLTSYIQSGQHPGGEKIFQACGTDATDLFTGKSPLGRVHSSVARAILSKYEIGVLN